MIKNLKKKEIFIWGGMVLVAIAMIVGVTLAQDYGVPKPPTPVYVPPIYNINQGTNATYDTGATTNPANNVVVAKPAVSLTSAENSLQQTICNAFPTTASRLPTDMLELGVLLPNDFDTQVSTLGDTVTFGTTATNVMRIHKNNKYFECFFHTIYAGTKNCSLNFTAKFASGATESGVINMTFTGDVGKYVPQNPIPADTQVGDHPVSKNPYSGMDPMPMLTRTSCSVTFQKPCPTKANSTLCGQCDVKYAGTDVVSKTENLGKCFYCSSNQTCTWGAGGLCSAYSCKNKATSKTTKKATTYFTNCSGCQKSGYYRNYNYSGTNKGTCQNYLRVCRACGAINVKTSCQ